MSPNSQSVALTIKHFPGGGPQENGADPHYSFGKNQAYPANNFNYHLKPFIAAIECRCIIHNGILRHVESFDNTKWSSFEFISGDQNESGILPEIPKDADYAIVRISVTNEGSHPDLIFGGANPDEWVVLAKSGSLLSSATTRANTQMVGIVGSFSSDATSSDATETRRRQ